MVYLPFYGKRIFKIAEEQEVIMLEIDRLKEYREDFLDKLSWAVRSHSMAAETRYMIKRIARKAWRILEMLWIWI